MIEILLNYPPSSLLPNVARTRKWQVNAKIARCEREAAFLAALPLRDADCVKMLQNKKRIPLRLFFYPRRGQKQADLDGLHAAMKAAIDGVADALEINDRHFAPQVVDWGNAKETQHGDGGFVLMQLDYE